MKVGIFSFPSNYQTNVSQTFGLPGVNIDDLASGLALQNISGLRDSRRYAEHPADHEATSAQTSGIADEDGGRAQRQGRRRRHRCGGSARRKASSRMACGTYDNAVDTQRDRRRRQRARLVPPRPAHASAAVAHAVRAALPHQRTECVLVQDDWRAKSWLTLNLGVRYDIFTPFTEEQNRLSNLDPTTGTVLVAGANGVSRSAGVKTDYSNIGPRLGFAATVSPSTVCPRRLWRHLLPRQHRVVCLYEERPALQHLRTGDQQRHAAGRRAEPVRARRAAAAAVGAVDCSAGSLRAASARSI